MVFKLVRAFAEHAQTLKRTAVFGKIGKPRAVSGERRRTLCFQKIRALRDGREQHIRGAGGLEHRKRLLKAYRIYPRTAKVCGGALRKGGEGLVQRMDHDVRTRAHRTAFCLFGENQMCPVRFVGEHGNTRFMRGTHDPRHIADHPVVGR